MPRVFLLEVVALRLCNLVEQILLGLFEARELLDLALDRGIHSGEHLLHPFLVLLKGETPALHLFVDQAQRANLLGREEEDPVRRARRVRRCLPERVRPCLCALCEGVAVLVSDRLAELSHLVGDLVERCTGIVHAVRDIATRILARVACLLERITEAEDCGFELELVFDVLLRRGATVSRGSALRIDQCLGTP
jgi:hypothetical protein